jgi:hypothetical protein
VPACGDCGGRRGGASDDDSARPAGQPVLPPAYGSNQIAQRNLQIGETCTFNISNTTTSAADLLIDVNYFCR